MELHRLRYFMYIVETDSMGRATLNFNIGVSALNQQITRLESELAIHLLQRASRGATPTGASLVFYSQAQLALRHTDDAILTARRARLSSHASVGMIPSTASVLGVPFINTMRESYPDVRLYLVESLSGNLEWMISTCQLDLAIVFQQEKILHWDARPVLEECLFLVGTHTLLVPLQEDHISPDQLTSLPLIIPSQSHSLRDKLEAVCQQHHLSVGAVADIDGLTLLTQAIHSGLGAALQPEAAISHLDHQALRVIDVVSPILSRPNFLVNLFNDRLTPAGLAIRVILSKVTYRLMESDHWPGVTLYTH